MSMSSSKPYFIRALYEWVVDNNCTPHILVDAHAAATQVPQQHVNKDGQIILNISPSAVKDFFMDNTAISFNARFSGVANNLYIPMAAIMGIYARENGQGMMFEPEANPTPPPTAPVSPTTPSPASKVPGAPATPKRPGLRVVK